jgi:peptidoglycan/xylan/chitin deacetylase (PgdA/CDA1 family)
MVYKDFETEELKVSLTFDCAWGADDIDNILSTLDKYQEHATFFVVGTWAEKYPEAVKKIIDAGQQIANHSYSHEKMTTLKNIETKPQPLSAWHSGSNFKILCSLYLICSRACLKPRQNTLKQ